MALRGAIIRVVTVVRRVLLVIGSLTAAWVVANLMLWPLLAFATDAGATANDARASVVVAVAAVALGALIYRGIVRGERARTAER